MNTIPTLGMKFAVDLSRKSRRHNSSHIKIDACMYLHSLSLWFLFFTYIQLQWTLTWAAIYSTSYFKPSP